jgi:hypothetical protein
MREKVGRWFQEKNDDVEEHDESILMYGAEIWGWKEQEEVEKVQEKYLRGVLGVDRETPAYIVREECKRNNRLIGKESDKVWR